MEYFIPFRIMSQYLKMKYKTFTSMISKECTTLCTLRFLLQKTSKYSIFKFVCKNLPESRTALSGKGKTDGKNKKKIGRSRLFYFNHAAGHAV